MSIPTFKQYFSEGEKIKVPCSRCGGTGHYSYNPTDGSRCFGCNGAGYEIVDEDKWKESQKRKKQKQERDKKKRDELIKKNKQEWEEKLKKYYNDPRVSPYMLNQMHKSQETFAYYSSLLKSIDDGRTTNNTKKILEIVGFMPLEVPYAKKDFAKGLGCRWSMEEKKWYWNLAWGPLPQELEIFSPTYEEVRLPLN